MPRDFSLTPATRVPQRPARRAFLGACGALALSGLGGCGPGKEPLLRIASHVWPGYETLFLARQMGWLDAANIRLVELLSATESLRALYAGSVEAAALTLDEVLTARAEGLDLRVVLVFNLSAGADVLLARAEITELSQLAGKRVGVEHTAVGAVMLAEVLRRAGLPPSAIEAVPLTIDAQALAFQRGEIDALVTYHPTAARLEAAGARRLFDSREIPGRIIDVLAITPRALATSRASASALLAAHFRALRHVHEQADDALHRMAPRLGLDAAGVRHALDQLQLPGLADNRAWLEGSPAPLESSAVSLGELMWREKLLPREINVADLADASLLPARDA